MKKALLSMIALACLSTTIANAQDVKFSGSVTLANDYIWRGATQTDNDPAIFLSGQLNAGNFYFGAGTENVDFLTINQEYDFWAGYVFKLDDKTSLDLGLVRYGYVDSPIDIDTLEVKAALSRTIGKASLSGTIMHTGDYFGSGSAATYYEVAGSNALSDKLSLSGALGYQAIADNDGDYTTWNLGLGYSINKNVGLDFRYHDAENFDESFVASIKFSF